MDALSNKRISRRKMLKLLGAGATAAYVAACAPPAAPAPAEAPKAPAVSKGKPFEGITLNTLGGPDPTGWEAKENALFEEKYGAKVNVTTVPYGEQRQKLTTAFMTGGSAYDFFVIDCIEVPEYVEAGWVLDITDWVTDEMKQDLLPFAADGMMYKGRWYGLPWISEWKSFVYNEAHLEKAGISELATTWDQFVKDCQTLQEKGVVPKYATAWSWLQGEAIICDFVALAVSFGGQFFDEDQNPLFNGEGAVNALQFMRDTIYEYKITNPASLTWSEREVDDAAYAGDISYFLKWGLPLIPLNNPEISKVVGQCQIGLLPSYDGQHTATCSGPMGLAISSGSKHKEAAWAYLQFRAGREGAKRNAIGAGIVPGWASLFKDPEVLEAIPGLDLMLEQAKHVVNRPRVPWYYEFSTTLQVELQNALTDKKSPQEALDDAVAKTLEIKEKFESKKG
ncbi:MAG: extracellular solute-binding protein [Chloroflexi bacterium]|nr:extracellular solute-binding protein [Chloroflexota bacterium]